MTEPLTLKEDSAWTVLPYGQPVTNGDGIQASYETVLVWSVAEQEAFGLYRPEPAPPLPAGKVEVLRTLIGSARPRWQVTYADAPPPLPEPVPETVTDWQFAGQAAEQGIISKDSALAWVARGEVPAVLKDAVDARITDPERHFKVMLFLSGSKEYPRAHPLTPLLAPLLGMADAEGNADGDALDAFWRAAGQR